MQLAPWEIEPSGKLLTVSGFGKACVGLIQGGGVVIKSTPPLGGHGCLGCAETVETYKRGKNTLEQLVLD